MAKYIKDIELEYEEYDSGFEPLGSSFDKIKELILEKWDDLDLDARYESMVRDIRSSGKNDEFFPIKESAHPIIKDIVDQALLNGWYSGERCNEFELSVHLDFTAIGGSEFDIEVSWNYDQYSDVLGYMR